jgi:hypothetical protein
MSDIVTKRLDRLAAQATEASLSAIGRELDKRYGDDDRTVWLIERDDLESGRTHYYCEPLIRGRHSWTTDVYQATQFQTKAEADAAIGAATGLHAREHIFGLGSAPNEPVS